MILKEFNALAREKFLNTSFLKVVVLAFLADAADGLGSAKARAHFVAAARDAYWKYVNERQHEFDVAVSQWQGSAEFTFIIKRYTARGVNEIKSVVIKANAMHEAYARLMSYNHGPGFAVISKFSEDVDQGIWAEITNVKEEFLPAPDVDAAPSPDKPKLKDMLEGATKIILPPTTAPTEISVLTQPVSDAQMQTLRDTENSALWEASPPPNENGEAPFKRPSIGHVLKNLPALPQVVRMDAAHANPPPVLVLSVAAAPDKESPPHAPIHAPAPVPTGKDKPPRLKKTKK